MWRLGRLPVGRNVSYPRANLRQLANPVHLPRATGFGEYLLDLA